MDAETNDSCASKGKQMIWDSFFFEELLIGSQDKRRQDFAYVDIAIIKKKFGKTHSRFYKKTLIGV